MKLIWLKNSMMISLDEIFNVLITILIVNSAILGSLVFRHFRRWIIMFYVDYVIGGLVGGIILSGLVWVVGFLYSSILNLMFKNN